MQNPPWWHAIRLYREGFYASNYRAEAYHVLHRQLHLLSAIVGMRRSHAMGPVRSGRHQLQLLWDLFAGEVLQNTLLLHESRVFTVGVLCDVRLV